MPHEGSTRINDEIKSVREALRAGEKLPVLPMKPFREILISSL
jgi:hypothetical protein